MGKHFWNMNIVLLQIFIFTLVSLLLSLFSLLYSKWSQGKWGVYAWMDVWCERVCTICNQEIMNYNPLLKKTQKHFDDLMKCNCISADQGWWESKECHDINTLTAKLAVQNSIFYQLGIFVVLWRIMMADVTFIYCMLCVVHQMQPQFLGGSGSNCLL
jgi:hypothetical protein